MNDGERQDERSAKFREADEMVAVTAWKDLEVSTAPQGAKGEGF